MHIPTWRHPIASLWRRSTAAWPAALWRALPIAVIYGLGALGAPWYASPVWGAAATPEIRSPSQYMEDGRHAFQRGDFEDAATNWQQAERLYAATKQLQARGIALTSLARAL